MIPASIRREDLIINVSSLPKSGIIKDGFLDATDWDLVAPFLCWDTPLKLVLNVNFDDQQNIIANGNVLAQAQAQCGRCNDKYTLEIMRDITFFSPAGHSSVIDLAQFLREEIILNYPLKFLCSDKCKGLCPDCGVNLNKINCNCKPRNLKFNDTLHLNRKYKLNKK